MIMDPKSKRTRRSRGQSKYGCYTCKARKVKCDERKPTCLVCQNARLECEGYSSKAYEDSSSTTSEHVSTTPDEMAASLPSTSLDGSQLVQTGLNVLVRSYDDDHVIGQYALRQLIEQYVTVSPATNAACAAFGAAHELQKSIRGSAHDTRLVLRFETYYGQALMLVKREINSLQVDACAVLTSCTLLSAIELIFRRWQAAFMHLRAACRVFQPRYAELPEITVTVPVHRPLFSIQPTVQRPNFDVGIDMLLRIYDIQHLTFYNYAQKPLVQPLALEFLETSIEDHHVIGTFDKSIIEMTHAASVFIARVGRNALSNVQGPSIRNEQSRYVFLLQRWTSLLTRRLYIEHFHAERDHILVLRNLCVAILIQTKALFAFHETAWDMYSDYFQLLISSTETVLQSRKTGTLPKHRVEATSFTALIGIIQPIHFAALKYRDPHWRRRAIDCIFNTAREGPWIGLMLGSIATRVMDLEESKALTQQREDNQTLGNNDAVQSVNPSTNLDHHIPASARLSAVYIIEDAGAINSAVCPSADSGSIKVKLFKTQEMVPVLNVRTAIGAYTDQVDNQTSNFNDVQPDLSVWETWDELIRFGPDTQHQGSPQT